jgi:hypothetical protein
MESLGKVRISDSLSMISKGRRGCLVPCIRGGPPAMAKRYIRTPRRRTLYESEIRAVMFEEDELVEWCSSRQRHRKSHRVGCSHYVAQKDFCGSRVFSRNA